MSRQERRHPRPGSQNRGGGTASFLLEAVEALVDLTGRYMHEQYLPEKAIQMMDEVALAAKQEHGAGSMVTEEDGKGGVRGGQSC